MYQSGFGHVSVGGASKVLRSMYPRLPACDQTTMSWGTEDVCTRLSNWRWVTTVGSSICTTSEPAGMPTVLKRPSPAPAITDSLTSTAEEWLCVSCAPEVPAGAVDSPAGVRGGAGSLAIDAADTATGTLLAALARVTEP